MHYLKEPGTERSIFRQNYNDVSRFTIYTSHICTSYLFKKYWSNNFNDRRALEAEIWELVRLRLPLNCLDVDEYIYSKSRFLQKIHHVSTLAPTQIFTNSPRRNNEECRSNGSPIRRSSHAKLLQQPCIRLNDAPFVPCKMSL